MSDIITLTTDFGTRGSYVGAMKGAILTVAPQCQLIDISHEIPAQDIRYGAYTLMSAVDTFPHGTVHLAVVDPGVGGNRRAVAIAVRSTILIGPDNGLLVWALREIAGSAGIQLEIGGPLVRLPPGVNAVVLDQPSYWRHPVSSTFHGRDVFGPTAAWLSRGEPLNAVGSSITELCGLPFPEPVQDGSTLRAEILAVDHFGNLITNVRANRLTPFFVVEVGHRSILGPAANYESSEELIALIGSGGFLEVSVPGGSAADLLSVGARAPIGVTDLSPR